jgi:hypothetical protein
MKKPDVCVYFHDAGVTQLDGHHAVWRGKYFSDSGSRHFAVIRLFTVIFEEGALCVCLHRRNIA